MSASANQYREGSLEAPTRFPLGQNDPRFYDVNDLNNELERVFDICHGCRRCVSLCQAFPTLFDLVDESETMEVDGVAKKDYQQVVEQCFLCDLCYMTKCPYVPPHEWAVDFPHLMLRAKAQKFQQGKVNYRDRLLSNTDELGKRFSGALTSKIINQAKHSKLLRQALAKTIAISAEATLPDYTDKPLHKRVLTEQATATESDNKVLIFATCFGHYNQPDMVLDLKELLAHNAIDVSINTKMVCCGMPKLEIGDLASVAALFEKNKPLLLKAIASGNKILTPIPSCTLMFKQELPLMFPDDSDVALIQQHCLDPFEYLIQRHKAGQLNSEFKHSLGKIAYHVACHQRVQNIGLKTRDILQLIPDTEVIPIERCSGHDGTYAVRQETHQYAVKIRKPTASRVVNTQADYFTSDCILAGHHIAEAIPDNMIVKTPYQLLKIAYGI